MSAPTEIYRYASSSETSAPGKICGPAMIAVGSVSSLAFGGATLTIQIRPDDTVDWESIGTFDGSSTELAREIAVPGFRDYEVRISAASTSGTTDVVVYLW